MKGLLLAPFLVSFLLGIASSAIVVVRSDTAHLARQHIPAKKMKIDQFKDVS
jgi:hypothetical protein